MNYVIIGNSTAAVGCIEGIRKVDTKGKITVISDEPHHTYGRPLISYMLLGKTDEEHMKYRPDDFYEKNIHLTRPYHDAESLKNILQDSDVYITGSDQVWNPEWTGKDYSFLLSWVKDDKHKISCVKTHKKGSLFIDSSHKFLWIEIFHLRKSKPFLS